MTGEVGEKGRPFCPRNAWEVSDDALGALAAARFENRRTPSTAVFQISDVEPYVWSFVNTFEQADVRIAEVAYIDPSKVVSPKANWTLIKVLRNGETHGKGDNDAALALGNWDDQDGTGPHPVFAVRWNGTKKDATGVGNPQSRGLPTWFIVPYWMNEAILRSDLIPDGEKPLVAALIG